MNEMLEKTEVSSSGEKTEWRCKEGVGLVKARAWLAELKPGQFRDGYTAEFYEVKSREVRVRKPLCSSFFQCSAGPGTVFKNVGGVLVVMMVRISIRYRNKQDMEAVRVMKC